MQAHTLEGTQFSGPARRSLISFTTDETLLPKFGKTKFTVAVPKNSIISQTTVNGTESEVFIMHMIKVTKK